MDLILTDPLYHLSPQFPYSFSLKSHQKLLKMTLK